MSKRPRAKPQALWCFGVQSANVDAKGGSHFYTTGSGRSEPESGVGAGRKAARLCALPRTPDCQTPPLCPALLVSPLPPVLPVWYEAVRVPRAPLPLEDIAALEEEVAAPLAGALASTVTVYVVCAGACRVGVGQSGSCKLYLGLGQGTCYATYAGTGAKSICCAQVAPTPASSIMSCHRTRKPWGRRYCGSSARRRSR